VAEDLLRLALDLLFLRWDAGDGVAEHVARERTTLAPGPGDGLQRGHHHGANAEGIVQRFQRDGQPGRRAVWDGGDEAAPTARPALIVKRFGMGVVDPRDQDRDVGLIAKRGRRTDDGHAFREAWLPFLRDLFRDRAE